MALVPDEQHGPEGSEDVHENQDGRVEAFAEQLVDPVQERALEGLGDEHEVRAEGEVQPQSQSTEKAGVQGVPLEIGGMERDGFGAVGQGRQVDHAAMVDEAVDALVVEGGEEQDRAGRIGEEQGSSNHAPRHHEHQADAADKTLAPAGHDAGEQRDGAEVEGQPGVQVGKVSGAPAEDDLDDLHDPEHGQLLADHRVEFVCGVPAVPFQ